MGIQNTEIKLESKMKGHVSSYLSLLCFQLSHQKLYLVKTDSGGDAAEVTGDDYQNTTPPQYVGDCDIDEEAELPSYYLSYTLECKSYEDDAKVTTTTTTNTTIPRTTPAGLSNELLSTNHDK